MVLLTKVKSEESPLIKEGCGRSTDVTSFSDQRLGRVWRAPKSFPFFPFFSI